MSDFSSLQTKVNDLKAKVEQNSITPAYLGALLDDFITQMQAIDMTGLSDDVSSALANSRTALENAQSALTKAGNAETSANSALQNALSAIEKANAALQSASYAESNAASALSNANDAKSIASSAKSSADSATTKANDAISRISSIEGMIGSPDGIAPLDENGHIPSSHIPPSAHNVLEFDGMLNFDVPIQHASATDGVAVFHVPTNTFLLKSTGTGTIKYYNSWFGAEAYGVYSADGRIPKSRTIYLDISTNKQYRWNGSTLIVTGSDLALGETAQTAYSGDKGKQLREDVNILSSSVTDLSDTVNKHVADVGVLEFKGYVDSAIDVMNAPDEGVYFASNDKKFVSPGASDPEYPADYNVFDRTGACIAPRTDRIFRMGSVIFRFDDVEKDLIEIGGGSATGNIINIHEISKDWNTTNRGEAAGKVPMKLRTGGRKITFMSAPSKWQTWQFVGSLVSDWSKEEFWRQEIRSVSINGGEAPTPDGEGNVDLKFNIDVDSTINGESDHAVANKAVVSALNEVESQIPRGFGFDANTRMFTVTDADGETLASFNIPGGGSGGDTNPTAIEITVQSPMIDTLKEGDPYTLEYLWRHYNINTNLDTQYGGTAELIVQGSVVERKAVVQGFNSFDVGPWLASGLNTVRIRLTADDGAVNQSPSVKLTAVTLALRSLYDISTANTIGNPLQIRYIVTGSGDKNVSFKVNNADAGTHTISGSGVTSIKTIPTTGMPHSVALVEMMATRDLGGDTVLSTDPLRFDVMIIDRNSTTPLIALERKNTAQQYSTIDIPFAVYDPTSTSATVEIFLGDELIQRQIVDRSRRVFSYRAKQNGDLTFSFKVKNDHTTTVNSLTVNVTPADTQVEAETDALSLYLSSSGRSNDADNRADWEFTSESGIHTKAQFSNCNFDAQSGWLKDANGLTALHLEKGAQCYIPFTPLATDAKLVGKTIEIEFEVSNCFDMDATVISCLSGNVGFEIKAQEAYFSSALKQQVSSKFKQDERLRIGFQVEQVSGTNRFMYLFINGKMSGVVQYDTNDYFVQNPAVGISLGNASCELDVYNIRVYENTLTFRQMVNNYIADMDDTDVMFAKLAANDILNEDSAEAEISYEKAVEKLPCITFIGELPKFKGDKKKNTKIIYEDRQHPEFSFSLNKAQNDVQGTSSQYYPRKNWKWKALEKFIMAQSGEEVKKYALRGVDGFGNLVPQKPVKTFCLKADFAESSGTHNTGAANMIHEVLKNAGIITPMQAVDDTVRTTIYGFPILMFHQETESSPRTFIGKYNFNNDKSTHDTFGFQDIPGFNKGMINRDDYLVWEDSLTSLQGNADALAAAVDEEIPYYLIENGDADALTNHLVEYDEAAGAWVDRGEMWRWDVDRRLWSKRDGSTCRRSDGILDKVEAGELVENNVECWEFLNNGNPMCLFHKSDFSTRVYGADIPDWIDLDNCNEDENGKYALYWTSGFEPRYPDNDDLNRQFARGKIPMQLKRVADWLASLAINNPELTDVEKNTKAALFAGEINSYFDKKMMLAYDILRELFVAADQGAKNMMWAFIDGLVYIIFYDNDTIWLINNEGRISFIPYVEPHSRDRLGKFVFNGESSTLWNLIERVFEAEMNDLYNTMVSQGGLTYERAKYWFNTSQSDRWCETVYNADSKYKYIDSFGAVSEDGSGTSQNYLDIAQGSREEHRKWAMYERFQYINAKRAAGSYRDNRIYLRANTAGDSSVAAKVEVSVTAAQDWYFCFRFSGNAGFNPVFVKEGESHIFSAPEGANPNDTETYIHQADRISDLGDLSVLYPTTLEVTQGRMLTRLVVGNKTDGYIGKLATLTLGTHPLMRYINVCNIPTLTSSIDLTGCSGIEEVEAQGSRITGVNLPAGSSIARMHLPETVVQLEFDRLPNLTNDNLVIDGYASIQTVNITDCAKLNPMKVLDNITETPGNSLQYVRVTGGTLRGTGLELIRLIELGVKGAVDRNGKPEILGTYSMTKIPESNELDIILDGINPDGFSVVIVVEAYINAIDGVNGEFYSGTAEVDTVTLDNIGDHLLFYNGETAEEYVQRIADANKSIHEIITL